MSSSLLRLQANQFYYIGTQVLMFFADRATTDSCINKGPKHGSSDNSKHVIRDIIKSLKGSSTIIMISHSSSALCKCEKIYRLDKNILKLQNKNS